MTFVEVADSSFGDRISSVLCFGFDQGPKLREGPTSTNRSSYVLKEVSVCSSAPVLTSESNFYYPKEFEQLLKLPYRFVLSGFDSLVQSVSDQSPLETRPLPLKSLLLAASLVGPF